MYRYPMKGIKFVASPAVEKAVKAIKKTGHELILEYKGGFLYPTILSEEYVTEKEVTIVNIYLKGFMAGLAA